MKAGLQGALLFNLRMQWRSKVRSQQHVQEKEADEQALRMKELQQLVVTERMAKEQLETQVGTSPLSNYITYHQCLLQISSCLQLACFACRYHQCLLR